MREDWTVYAPGQRIRCPTCHRYLGIVSPLVAMHIRVNPEGRFAGPTAEGDYSERCQHRGCGMNLERRIVRVAA